MIKTRPVNLDSANREHYLEVAQRARDQAGLPTACSGVCNWMINREGRARLSGETAQTERSAPKRHRKSSGLLRETAER